MHYDFQVNVSNPLLRDFAACPALSLPPMSAGGKSWGIPLGTGLPLEYLRVIVAFSPAASRGGELPPVAYSFQARTRLGHSPKGAFDRAYHNMTGKAQGKTYLRLDKKSGPPTPLAPNPFPLAFRSPASTATSAVRRPSVAILRDQNNDFKAFLIS
jgi:hypothetical protein